MLSASIDSALAEHKAQISEALNEMNELNVQKQTVSMLKTDKLIFPDDFRLQDSNIYSLLDFLVPF